MKLSDTEKLNIFNLIEDKFDPVIELICNKNGIIVDYSKSFTAIVPEISTKKIPIFTLVEEESIDLLKEFLNIPGECIIHFKTPEDIIETFSCITTRVTEGIFIFGIRIKTTYNSSIESITRERNILHQKLLNQMTFYERAFVEVNENCDLIHNFFNRIINSSIAIAKLTDREFEIFILMHRQQSAKKLAEYLNISESTVDKHLHSIKEKTGSTSLAEVAALSRKFTKETIHGEFEIAKLHKLVERTSHLLNTFIIDKELTASGAGLTDRESQIVALIRENKTNSEIGEILYVSENTVKSHITRIFKKLNLTSRKELSGY